MSTLPVFFPPTPPRSHPSSDSEDPPDKEFHAHATVTTRSHGSRMSMQGIYAMPSTPPVQESPTSSPYSGITRDSPNEHYADTLRNRRARRSASGIATSGASTFLPPRKFTDPPPRRPFLDDTEELSPQQLDVDLEAYSTDYDDSRAPTLSFVTTSTVESVASTPQIGGIYGDFQRDSEKQEMEPRFRLRSKAGRASAYSSAESSMASGAYSYHSYADGVYDPHPPPLPMMPLAFSHQNHGLGISGELNSPSSSSSGSPAYGVWQSKHMRHESASTCTTEEDSTSPNAHAYHFDGYNLSEQLGPKPARALLMVEEGRERILDAARLHAMGGVDGVDIDELEGVTHLLLSGIGSSILPILHTLLATLAPTLLVADLSDNDLTFLPTTLHDCHALEELNLSGNPLRSVPTWMGDLCGLHVLVLDGCGLSGLPVDMSRLRHLHTLCARRNKLVSLPPWLCLLDHLETLRIDENPFAPEWLPIVSPILAKGPLDPLRPAPSIHSLNSSTTSSSIDRFAEAPEPLAPIAEDSLRSAPLQGEYGSLSRGANRLRKMRSAGTLLNLRSLSGGSTSDELLSPTALSPPPLSAGAPSTSSSRFDNLGSAVGRRASAQDESKPHKWGFLRKMSMNRLKGEKTATLTASASTHVKLMPPPLRHLDTEPGPLRPPRPGFLTAQSALAVPSRSMGIEEEIEAGPQPVKRAKRRSFLPIDPTPPSINIAIPSTSPFMDSHPDDLPTLLSQTTIADDTLTASSSLASELQAISDARSASGLESIKSYLRDLFDLSRAPIEPYGGFMVSPGDTSAASSVAGDPASPVSALYSISDRRRGAGSRCGSSMSVEHPNDFTPASPSMDGKKFKNDRHKRARVLREIYETERTYVRGLGELVSIYVRPSAQPVKAGQPESVIPAAERKVVFGGIESILTIHRENLLPALEKAVKPLIEGVDDDEGKLSMQTAHVVGEVFRTYIAYMKQYSTYINNFDNALSRMESWTSSATPGFAKSSPTMANIAGIAASTPSEGMHSAQKKRVKHFLKRCREHPLHSQINLESYLLLPVQRVPRYKLLLEDLAMCTSPQVDAPRDTLDDALNEIAGLASLMNEEKRDAESRLRLYHWQQRITSKGPSPLVQPHRKLILDGSLTLIRLVKKASSYVEVDTLALGEGDDTVMPSRSVVPIEYITPEPMNRQMQLLLCTDLMVLAQPRAEQDGPVDLYNVLRMSTVREPASVIHGDVLRVVDNRSIYYFSGTSPSNVLEWCRAINSAKRR